MAFQGDKYEKGRDVKEIARLVRQDIRKAVSSGVLPKLKTSVTISRFAGGCSLSVYIKEIEGGATNPESKFEHDTGMFVPPRYTETCSKVLEMLKGIVNQYKFDASDPMTDYWSVNFYDTVGVAWQLEKQEREARS